MGNICIQSSRDNGALDISSCLSTSMDTYKPRNCTFGHSGLRTTIIDYTLSRATKSSENRSTTIYDPMKLPSLFRQKGMNPEQCYQFDTYRKMRTHALAVEQQSRKDDPSRENKKKDKWARFLPRTNVMWLQFLLSTMLYRSESRIVADSSDVTQQLQANIYDNLKELLVILDASDEGPEAQPPRSASEVVKIAHRQGLLTDQDLVAIKECLE